MSSLLSNRRLLSLLLAFTSLLLAACGGRPWNNPYPAGQDGKAILYQSFEERPKHLDPAIAYSENEYEFIAQIYEPPFQYHYLKRPYQLVPLTAAKMREIKYLNKEGRLLPAEAENKGIAFTDYIIDIKPGISYQPHPALAKKPDGNYLYHQLSGSQISSLTSLAGFKETGTRELIAEDYAYQIKRLAHPKNQSPIAEMMKKYIVGFEEFSESVKSLPKTAVKDKPMPGVAVNGKYQYRIRINGKYPQFMYWLAMSFFAPMPWEADAFYNQPGLADNNITLDWYPIGTGAYYLAENNPKRRMILRKNPNYHPQTYPEEGEAQDRQNGLLADTGKTLPFIDEVIFMLEKETIPYWTKFLQGYYDASGISSDNFDQAVQFTGSGGVNLTPSMQEKGIRLQTTVETSSFYMGFNMADPVVGGYTEQTRKLRQAISIAVDYEEFISIFTNERGLAAQGILPPGIFGFAEGEKGINPVVYDWINGKPQRKNIEVARRLMQEAGYGNGIDPKTKQALILNFDTTATSVDDRPRMAWYRKQFEKLGIKLVVRSTDYNRFQEKMRTGNAQIFAWGWNADYPDPENFFFLLYGGNAKVKYGGENAGNYQNPEFDRLFEQMRNMDNNSERFGIIQQMQNLVRQDAPWIFGLHPKKFSLFHGWLTNRKPHAMANNTLKYLRINPELRTKKRQAWNQPILWPLLLGLVLLALAGYFALHAYRRRTRKAFLKSGEEWQNERLNKVDVRNGRQ